MRKKFEDGPWICDACDRVFKSESRLHKHQRRHDREPDDGCGLEDKKGRKKLVK